MRINSLLEMDKNDIVLKPINSTSAKGSSTVERPPVKEIIWILRKKINFLLKDELNRDCLKKLNCIIKMEVK